MRKFSGTERQNPGTLSEYSIDPKRKLVNVRFARKLTARDIEDYAAALRGDPQFDPAMAEIVDLRAVEAVGITPEQAIALADLIDPFSWTSRRAFVVSNEVQANSARMHKMLRSPAKSIAIFDSLAEAEEWVCTTPSVSSLGTGQVLAFPARTRP